VSIQVSGIGAQGGYEWKREILQKFCYVIHNRKLFKLYFVRYTGMPSSCHTQMKYLQPRDDLKNELNSVCYKDFTRWLNCISYFLVLCWMPRCLASYWNFCCIQLVIACSKHWQKLRTPVKNC